MTKIVEPPVGKMCHGVFPGGDDGDESDVSEFNLKEYITAVGKPRVAWVYFSHEWREDKASRRFPKNQVEWITHAGAAPYIRLMLRSTTDTYVCEPLFTLRAIENGQFDEDLIAWGKAAVESGVPFVCEWGTEMNGAWFPWNAIHNGGNKGCALFKKVFKHIVDTIGHREFITWVYHVTHESSPTSEWNAIGAYDPEPAYADWIGVSLYGAESPTESEYPVFSKGLQKFLDEVEDIRQGRPVMVCEFGFADVGQGLKAAKWAEEALESLLSGRWPQVRGFSWWNEGWKNDHGPSTEMRVQKLDAVRDVFRRLLEKYKDRLAYPCGDRLDRSNTQELASMPESETTGLIKRPSSRAIRLTFSYEGDQITLIDQQRVEMIVPGSDPILDEGQVLGCWIDVKDGQGRILFRRALHNPIRRDVEVFTEERSQNIARQTVPAPEGLFVVLLPDAELVDHVVLTQAGQTKGSGQSIKEIARFTLRK